MMQGAGEQRSEVARLLAQINSEYEAAQRGLFGTAAGSSRHDFITKRMETVGQLHEQLHDLVGDAAIAMIAEHLHQQPHMDKQDHPHDTLSKDDNET
jgi:hypothetical protein